MRPPNHNCLRSERSSKQATTTTALELADTRTFRTLSKTLEQRLPGIVDAADDTAPAAPECALKLLESETSSHREFRRSATQTTSHGMDGADSRTYYVKSYPESQDEPTAGTIKESAITGPKAMHFMTQS